MLEFHHNHQQTMTLPSEGKKLTKNEEESMKIALDESGIRAIHPDRMEALADSMVEKLKNTHEKPRPWRTGGALEE